MKRHFLFLFATCLLFLLSCSNEKKPGIDYALIIHGGAGNSLAPECMNDEEQTAYKQKLNEALDKGLKILSDGGSSVDDDMN